jgi:hypothetical protein
MTVYNPPPVRYFIHIMLYAHMHPQDGYHFQNVLAPLVKLEAEYDRRMKEVRYIRI